MSSELGLFRSAERFMKESTLPDASALETYRKVRVEGWGVVWNEYPICQMVRLEPDGEVCYH